jgi:hypothetical protein
MLQQLVRLYTLNKIRGDDVRLLNQEGYKGAAIRHFKAVNAHVRGEVEVNHGKPRLGEPVFTLTESRFQPDGTQSAYSAIFFSLFFLLFVMTVLFFVFFFFSSSSAYSYGTGTPSTTTGSTFVYF